MDRGHECSMVLSRENHMVKKKHVQFTTIAAEVNRLPEFQVLQIFLDIWNKFLNAELLEGFAITIFCPEN